MDLLELSNDEANSGILKTTQSKLKYAFARFYSHIFLLGFFFSQRLYPYLVYVLYWLKL
ncbi:hypothetical protein BDF21DRAFT_413771 [Thamnidium elegans]|nr:hypothetical protein BDF21DRAFT_413771 [Thamnidium elegans]